MALAGLSRSDGESLDETVHERRGGKSLPRACSLLLFCGLCRTRRSSAAALYSGGCRNRALHSGRTRHGGGAGKDCGPDRRRHLEARRQRGRCRGRDRICHGGDLSARRQYRRRRFHGDPSRRTGTRISRSTIARRRRPRPRRLFSSGPTASPTRCKVARIPRSASAFPAHRPDLRWRCEKYGSGKFTLAELMQAGDRTGAQRRRHRR